MASFDDDIFDVFDENEPEDIHIEIPIKEKYPEPIEIDE